MVSEFLTEEPYCVRHLIWIRYIFMSNARHWEEIAQEIRIDYSFYVNYDLPYNSIHSYTVLVNFGCGRLLAVARSERTFMCLAKLTTWKVHVWSYSTFSEGETLFDFWSPVFVWLVHHPYMGNHQAHSQVKGDFNRSMLKILARLWFAWPLVLEIFAWKLIHRVLVFTVFMVTWCICENITHSGIIKFSVNFSQAFLVTFRNQESIEQVHLFNRGTASIQNGPPHWITHSRCRLTVQSRENV